ncbi:unnamed protein product [Amoebophrya sp. A120]|nr:unnamed protein product [Amoebophrya sp. A120]|eukprot:GSA120T00001524001.1
MPNSPSLRTLNTSGDVTSMRDLFKHKEAEMQSLHAAHFQELESVIQKREEDVVNLRHDFARLQNDFKYNLSLLEERDKELAMHDVTMTKLQSRLAERETLVLTLQDHLATTSDEHARHLAEKETEVKAVLGQTESLKRRIAELEEMGTTAEQRHKEQMQKLRTSKDAFVAEQERRHDGRVQELQETFRQELKTKTAEQSSKEALWKHQVEDLEKRQDTLTRELAAVHAERSSVVDQFTQLQRQYATAEESRREVSSLLDRVTRDHERDGAEFGSERKQLLEQLETTRSLLDKREREDAEKIQQLQQVSTRDADEYERRLERAKEDHDREVEWLKQDANRRIREMERLCLEKVDAAQREHEIKQRAMREELDRRVDQKQQELVTERDRNAANTERTVERLEDEHRREIASLQGLIDAEQEKNNRKREETEEMRKKFLAEQRRVTELCGELDILRAEKEDDTLTHKRDQERLQAEVEYHKQRIEQHQQAWRNSGASSRNIKDDFNPLFSGDFGHILVGSPSNSASATSGKKLTGGSSAAARRTANNVGGGTLTSSLTSPELEKNKKQVLSLPFDDREEVEAELRKENDSLRHQLLEIREVMAQMRLAAERRQLMNGEDEVDSRQRTLTPEKFPGSSSPDQPASGATGGPSSLVEAAQSRVRAVAAKAAASEHQSLVAEATNLRKMRKSEETLHLVKAKYEELLDCKEQELSSLRGRVTELQTDGEKLRFERSQLMELSNKLRYEAERERLPVVRTRKQPVPATPPTPLSKSGGGAVSSTSRSFGENNSSRGLVHAGRSGPNELSDDPTLVSGSGLSSSSSAMLKPRSVSFAPGTIEVEEYEREHLFETKLYAVEQALRNLEQQNTLLRRELEHSVNQTAAVQDRGGAVVVQPQTGAASSSSSSATTPSSRAVARARAGSGDQTVAYLRESVENTASQGVNESLIARARERVESAKLELNGHKIRPQTAPPPVENKPDAKTSAVPRPVSASEKLRALQKKRQEQRLKAVRNWANVPPPEEQG